MIASDPNLKAVILKWLHDSPLGGHSNRDTTASRVKSLFLSEYKGYVGSFGQTWKLEGVPETEVVCTTILGLKFFVYVVMVEKMGVRVPFNAFQKKVLGFLRVSPTQVTPNGWRFVRTFEIVMEALG